MKKLALAGSVLLVVAALSCTRELDIETPVSQKYVFEAVWADGSDTRTALQSDGTSVWWTTGEEINVFYGSIASGKFVSTNTEPAALTSFSGSLPVVTGTVEGGHSAPAFWGVYPYDAANTCDGETVTLTVPASQPATDGTFADKFFPAVAVSQDFALAFYNVCGGARFSVANAGIYAVTFEAVGGENLVGKVKVGFGSDGKPVVRQVSEGSAEVTVNAPAGGFVPGKYYFAAFLPGTLSQGIKITYRTTTQSASITNSNSLTVNRSRFGTIDRKDEGLTFVDGGGAEGADVLPEAIDLGLPSGLKWASFNLGATKPQEYGNYYAWGETGPKEDNYSWATYKWCRGSFNTLTKYCYNPELGYNGFSDGKTVLDLEDDAANVSLGGKWRMPTDAEWMELINNCTWTWYVKNRVNGRLVTASNGNSIFLPAAGRRRNTSLDGTGSYGDYWSSSLNTDYTDYTDIAWSVFFYSDDVRMDYDSRCYGFSVRPVYGDSPNIPVESVSLDKTEEELIVGKTSALVETVLPTYATDKSVSWSSDNTSVATVSPSGVVTAVASGTATITVTTTDGGKTATCRVTVKGFPVPEAVDMGLSVKWASFNLGASKPEEYGYYYAWGETEPKDDYYRATYKWCMGEWDTTTKYCTKSSYGYNGFTDGKTVLDLEDDAAHVNLGGKWRMPKRSEVNDLLSTRNDASYQWEWKSLNGHEGWLVTYLVNNNSIFLPAAGYRNDTHLYVVGSDGYYWSSSLHTDYPGSAWFVNFSSGGVYRSSIDRYYGLSVRAVSD